MNGHSINTESNTQYIVAWALTGLITFVFVFSAMAKLGGAESMLAVFEKWGLRDHLFLIAIGELVSALLFLIPRTHSLGALLLSAYLGGAIATHMQNGEPFIFPAALLLLLWLTAYLHHPEVLQSFRAGTE